MFDDASGMAMLCAETFRNGVRDAFGESIVADVLAPILKEIDSLRIFNEEFQRQILNIDQTLDGVREIQFKDYGRDQ